MDWRKTHYTDLSDELQSKVKTERQWAKLGFVPKSRELGERMYSNWFHNGTYTYFHVDDVRPASSEELDLFFADERKKRSEQRKKNNEKRAAEQKKLVDSLYDDLGKCNKEIINAQENYRTLCNIFRDLPCETVEAAENIVIDIETTGLSMYDDEILQVSIISADTGETLFNEYFKPFLLTSWDEAEKINHISPKKVKDNSFFIEAVSKINAIIENAKLVIGYNVTFDVNFLNAYGIKFEHHIFYDVMEQFAVVNGEYSDYYNDYKWQKLTTCTEMLGYSWAENAAHDSLEDCKATLFCYQKLQKPEWIERYINGIEERDRLVDL